MRTTLSLAMILVAGSLVSRADDPPSKGDLAKLQGAWKTEAILDPNSIDKKLTIVLDISGSSINMTVTPPGRDDSQVSKGTLKIDETAKPKTWDMVEGMSGDRKLPNMYAIYDVEGDSLKLCFMRNPSEGRPKEFKNADSGPPSFFTFTKQKKK